MINASFIPVINALFKSATLPFRCVTGLNCIGERSYAIISVT